MDDLRELEAITRLKYKCLRCLDLKLWDEMRECFVADASSASAATATPTPYGS